MDLPAASEAPLPRDIRMAAGGQTVAKYHLQPTSFREAERKSPKIQASNVTALRYVLLRSVDSTAAVECPISEGAL
jgi:hypothetical protein